MSRRENSQKQRRISKVCIVQPIKPEKEENCDLVEVRTFSISIANRKLSVDGRPKKKKSHAVELRANRCFLDEENG
jgi:hypothetical protein